MKQILSVIFSILLFTSCNVYHKTHQTFSIQLKNGDIKKFGEIATKKSTKTDQFSYYQRWDNELIDYYENGQIKSTSVSHHKIGTYGRPCKELLNHYTEYNEKGIKVFESKDVCDCRTSTTIEYNDKGKVVSKKVVKVKRVK